MSAPPVLSAPRYLISDRRQLFSPDETFSEAAATLRLNRLAERAADARIEYFQLREKDLPARRLLNVARALAVRLKNSSTRLLINERFDIALAAGAAGVHLPARALAAEAVRRCVPSGFLIAASVHNEAELKAAESAADFAVCGPIFDTPEKTTLGVENFQRLAHSSALPLFALGGITPENAPEALRAGAAGVAGIRLFLPPDFLRHLSPSPS